MDKEFKGQPMKSASHEAEKRQYHKHVGKSGETWLVADQQDCGSNIYVSDPNPPQNSSWAGFGGRTLHFDLVGGDTIDLTAPWSSNSEALFHDTGVDVRDRHMTYGAIGLKRSYGPGSYGSTTIEDVIYADEEPMIGTFDRIGDMAQVLANERQVTLYYYKQSFGGSTSSQVKPELQNDKKD